MRPNTVIHDLWYMIHDMWNVIRDTWYMWYVIHDTDITWIRDTGYVIHDIWYIICDTRDAWYMWYTILDICDMWYMIHDTCDIWYKHITAPGGRYAGGNPVQQIFLHPQPRPLRHSCGETLVLVIIFDYIYRIWTKYTFTSSTLATPTPLRWDLKASLSVPCEVMHIE